MAATHDPPLDEIQWRSPPIAQTMGGIQTNTVLPYFSQSPFFDPTSNNAIITTQATYNPNLFYLIQTREAFEARLKTMQGLEFMVSEDPSENGHKIDNTEVWVIQKRSRRKKQGAEDEITPLGSYFVVGENIYMAPSVGNVLRSRLLSIVASLTKMFSAASVLPKFTSSVGHTYLPPAPNGLHPALNLQFNQTSKESTPAPGVSEANTSTKLPLAPKLVIQPHYQSFQVLTESYRLSTRYGNEFMDENPLVGEPGSFILSKPRESGSLFTKPKARSSLPAKIITSADTRPTNIAPSTKKASKGPEKSPISPGVRDKKARRKSKAAGVGTTVTPK